MGIVAALWICVFPVPFDPWSAVAREEIFLLGRGAFSVVSAPSTAGENEPMSGAADPKMCC